MSNVDPVGYRAMTRLLNLLTALSLLLCVAACGFWARGHWVRDWVSRLHLERNGNAVRGSEWAFWSGDGDAAVGFTRYAWVDGDEPFDVDWSRQMPVEWGWSTEAAGGSVFRPGYPGFCYSPMGNPTDPNYSVSIGVPLWFAALAFAILPIGRGVRWRLYRGRIRTGLCPACGYNLTGNVSGVCPECGSRR